MKDNISDRYGEVGKLYNDNTIPRKRKRGGVYATLALSTALAIGGCGGSGPTSPGDTPPPTTTAPAFMGEEAATVVIKSAVRSYLEDKSIQFEIMDDWRYAAANTGKEVRFDIGVVAGRKRVGINYISGSDQRQRASDLPPTHYFLEIGQETESQIKADVDVFLRSVFE